MIRRKGVLNQQGFTIVELMIATLVFSVILLVIMVGVIGFTNSYFKGVNSSTTQTTTRTAIETVTQAIQFSGGTISFAPASGPVTTYCIGSVQFDFNPGVQIKDSGDHALFESPNTAPSGTCNQKSFDTTSSRTSKELLGKNMRLSDFTVTSSPTVGNLYKVHMHVVYGDDDLLYSPGSAPGPAEKAPDAACKSQAGSQFCSMVDLTSTVEKRVQ